MKRSSKHPLALGIVFSFGALAAEPPPPTRAPVIGQIVTITRATPFFLLPTGKSKILADADPGAMLVLKDVSSRGTWIKLEDEDFNRGWIPANRSNFVLNVVKGDEATAPDDHAEGPFLTQRESNVTPPTPSPPASHEFAFWARHNFSPFANDPNGNFAPGFVYSYMLPGPSYGPGSQRMAWIGWQSGFAPAYDNGVYNGFTIPLRYRLEVLNLDLPFAAGPDMGMLYFHRKSDGATRWSLSFGYSLGWMRPGHSLFALARLGAELINQARISAELTVGLKL